MVQIATKISEFSTLAKSKVKETSTPKIQFGILISMFAIYAMIDLLNIQIVIPIFLVLGLVLVASDYINLWRTANVKVHSLLNSQLLYQSDTWVLLSLFLLLDDVVTVSSIFMVSAELVSYIVSIVLSIVVGLTLYPIILQLVVKKTNKLSIVLTEPTLEVSSDPSPIANQYLNKDLLSFPSFIDFDSDSRSKLDFSDYYMIRVPRETDSDMILVTQIPPKFQQKDKKQSYDRDKPMYQKSHGMGYLCDVCAQEDDIDCNNDSTNMIRCVKRTRVAPYIYHLNEAYICEYWAEFFIDSVIKSENISEITSTDIVSEEI